MSAETSRDVSLIKDEDLLRKMWQDTEDFGRKKEIRAHMYKLREARLRDFYNSGEVSTEIKKTTTTESKSCSTPTHADSLADHSFISMKTKEIRDSESPTRDVSYRVTGKGIPSQGWTVVTSNKKSDDGKTFTTSKLATTSGSEAIQGGKIDYAAKNEQQASVYRDGDDKNFTKAVGASSNTFIKQEAAGGDENSSFRSSSTKTSSSSKHVTESRATSGDVVDSQVIPSKMITQNQDDQFLVSRKTYTNNIPNELKNHPNYVDGKTKVTRETRTLPDGSTVTTTKYEVTGGSTTQSSKSSHYNTEQRSSTVNTSQQRSAVDTSKRTSTVNTSQQKALDSSQQLSSNIDTSQQLSRNIDTSQQLSSNIDTSQQKSVSSQRQSTVSSTQQKSSTVNTSQAVDSRINQNESKTTYITEPSSTTTTVTRYITDSRDQELQPATTRVITRTTKDQQVFDSADDSNKTTIIYSKNEPRDDVKSTTKTTIIRKVYDTREEPTTINDSNVTTRTTVVRNVDDVNKVSSTTDQGNTTTKTTVVKNIYDTSNEKRPVDNTNSTIVKTTLVKNIYDTRDQPRPIDDSTVTTTTTKTTRTEQINDLKDNRKVTNSSTKINEKFITVEQQDTGIRMIPKIQTPESVEPKTATPERPSKPQESYEVPERRQPIKPGKSELDTKTKPTDGQYETTYRTDYTSKRISVDVSPTHDAFARSLRAVSPDRISKCSSPSRGSLRNSTSSLRSSTSPEKRHPPRSTPDRSVSPEKNRHPSRWSPDRRSISPRKTTTNEYITHRNKTTSDKRRIATNTTTTTEIDSSTLTKKKNRTTKPRSRSPSPTSIASDIEYIRNTDIVTDLDTNETIVVTKSRPSTLEVTRKPTKKVTDRFPTSPLTDTSPKKSPNQKDVHRRSSLRYISPNKEPSPLNPDKPFKRTDTYEERCRQILGITNETEKRKNSLERITTTKKGTVTKTSTEKCSPNKETSSPTKRLPEKKIQEFPSQIRKSPEKEPSNRYPEKKSPTKDSPKISEFPSQIKKSPEKEPLRKQPDRKVPTKEASPGKPISEFPSQIIESPKKEPSGDYTDRKRPTGEIIDIDEYQVVVTQRETDEDELNEITSKISEYPSQIRRSPEKEPLGRYPEKEKPTTYTTKINEFPSQIRKSPQKESLGEYPEKKRPEKETPSGIDEFPSQIRRSPEREPLGEYPDKKRPEKYTATGINEFPSQIRKSPQKEPLGEYPDKKRPEKDSPTGINEFPSQIRRPAEKEPLEKYPERQEPTTFTSKINEFPSQVRKSPQKEPLGEYPEKKRPDKETPTGICEFPSQVRRTPQKEPLGEYPDKRRPDKETPSKVSEFPSQIRRPQQKVPSDDESSEEELLEEYPEGSSVSKISEFPSQIRKSPQKEPLQEYPEKKRPEMEVPKISEFPSQIRKPQDREHPGRYPDQPESTSPIRKSPEKEPRDDYPHSKLPIKKTPEEREKYPDKDKTTIDIGHPKEIPSQTPKPSESPDTKIQSERKPNREKPKDDTSKITEFPSQNRKSPEKKPMAEYPKKETLETNEFLTQVRQDEEREVVRKYSDTEKQTRITSQMTRQTEEEELLGRHPSKKRPTDDVSGETSSEEEPDDEHPEKPLRITSQTVSEKEPLKDKGRPSQKDTPDKINDLPQTKKSIQKQPDSKPQTKSPEKPLDKSPDKIKPRTDKEKPSEKTRPIKSNDVPSQTKKVPDKNSLETQPDKTRPKKTAPTTEEFPSQVRKPGKPSKAGIYPTSPSKREKPRERTESFSSLSTEEEKDIEEVVTVTKITELEGKVPVDEPVMTKRFISQLCRDDEIQRSNLTEKKNQRILDEEILETEDITTKRTVKKDLSRKTQDTFIENERTDTINKHSTPRTSSPIKKPMPEKNTITITKKFTASPKPDTKTPKKTVPDDKTKPREIKRTAEKITLYNVENLNEVREDNRIHIRTHRTDDTVNKKSTKTVVNGDVTRKITTKRPQTIKPDEPKTKKPIEKKPTQKQVTKSVTEVESRRITTDQKTPKRHVVTTTITVSPKTRPGVTKTPSRPVSSKPTPTKTTKKPKLQNGHVSSDDESIADSLEDLTEEIISTTLKQKGKVTRTTSEQVVKKKPDSKTTLRGPSKPELPQSKTKQEKKCITTKSIVINNDGTQREIIVDLQRSKSSREPTPEYQICPLPVSSDDDSTPRYPDQIAEPDDSNVRHKPKRLSDIPIMEGEDVTEFNRIVEIEDTSTVRIDKVEETDESLLSVNKKINKFTDTTEKTTKTKQGPAPKVARPKLVVNKDLQSDECLLSVSQKVNKFITTAEQLTTPQEFPQRPRSPKCQYYPDEEVNVSDKVAHFITTAENVVTASKDSTPKVERPKVYEVDERIKNDDCLLSVSDKVSKFINTAEKLTTDSKKTISLSKMDVKSSQKKTEPEKETSPTRRTSKETTPTRKPTNQYSTKPETESKYPRRDSSPKLSDSTPKSTRRPSEDEPKSVLSPTGRLRSTESVRKAKALFENISKDQHILKQRDILSRPSVFEGRKTKQTETARKLEYESEEDEKLLKSTRLVIDKVTSRPKSPEKLSRRSGSPDKEVPGYRKPLDKTVTDKLQARPKSPEKVRDVRGRSRSPDGDVPGYMRPLDKDVADKKGYRPKSPEKVRDVRGRSRSPDGDVPGYVRPLDKKGYRPKSPEKVHDVRGRSRSPDGDVPGYMRPLDKKGYRPKSPEKVRDVRGRSRSPDGDVPGYMRPLDKSVTDRKGYRPKSPERIHDVGRRSRTPDKDIPGYMRPLEKCVVDKVRSRPKSPERIHDIGGRRSQTPDGDIPGYMKPLDRSVVDRERFRPRSPERLHDVSRRSQTPDSDVPGYMRPLDRNVRPHSPHRDNLSQLSKKYIVKDEENTDVRQTKFGVSLKRTDSGRAVTTTTSTTKSRVVIEGITEEQIEEIYELEVLEELLEKVADYDLRRKIRSQIRLVRKLISEGKLVEVASSKRTIVREASPVKTTKQSRESIQRTTTEFKSYSYDERRSSSEYTKETRRSRSPETKTYHSRSPEKSPSKSTKAFPTQLKKTSSSKPVPEDNVPEWVKQRNLRKQTDTNVTSKTTTTTTSKKTRSSPVKETKPIDSITSSYGVGPTDENGSPLFGLKALRSRNVTDTTKVQGTVIRSQYYSENGEEPVGEISVTKYSTDPKDLGRNDVKSKGLTSVTTTQKFGYKDTPSLKNITTRKNKEICEANDDDVEFETKTTKVTRRGSVKALSQKFIENAVETSKSERQSSYPKAGLILRTSSFKDSASSGDSREGSAERTVTVKASSTKAVAGETFLTSRSKVTGVQDVISRMKSEDVRDGDSAEDVEARGLLNRFIGSQVILSGMEANVKSSTTTSNAKRTTKVTTTITEGGKPTTRTRIFQHPVTEEELESVWDEQTLRLLLEQSTDYEERRQIRARLRQVMAEQEACTELVEKASQDQIGSTFEGATETKKTVSEGPVTTTQVTRVTTQQVSKKPISPFAKFRQLDKQNSLNTPRTSN